MVWAVEEFSDISQWIREVLCLKYGPQHRLIVLRWLKADYPIQRPPNLPPPDPNGNKKLIFQKQTKRLRDVKYSQWFVT